MKKGRLQPSPGQKIMSPHSSLFEGEITLKITSRVKDGQRLSVTEFWIEAEKDDDAANWPDWIQSIALIWVPIWHSVFFYDNFLVFRHFARLVWSWRSYHSKWSVGYDLFNNGFGTDEALRTSKSSIEVSVWSFSNLLKVYRKTFQHSSLLI